jgi:hypothetical protein
MSGPTEPLVTGYWAVTVSEVGLKTPSFCVVLNLTVTLSPNQMLPSALAVMLLDVPGISYSVMLLGLFGESSPIRDVSDSANQMFS